MTPSAKASPGMGQPYEIGHTARQDGAQDCPATRRDNGNQVRARTANEHPDAICAGYSRTPVPR